MRISLGYDDIICFVRLGFFVSGEAAGDGGGVRRGGRASSVGFMEGF